MKRITMILAVAALALIAVPTVQAQTSSGRNGKRSLLPARMGRGDRANTADPCALPGRRKEPDHVLRDAGSYRADVFEMYGGLVNYQPDLTALLKKLNFDPECGKHQHRLRWRSSHNAEAD